MNDQNEEKPQENAQPSGSVLNALLSVLLNHDAFPSEDLTGEAQTGVHCGVEDVGCQDRYDGADYGYSEGVKACIEFLKNELDGCAEVSPMCKIRGSEITFELDVPECDIQKTAQEIWDNPEKYSDFKNGSDASFYGFLKFLWITYPDGSEKQLVSITR